MANEFQTQNVTGLSLYVVVTNDAGQYWNTSTSAFETLNTANWANYVIAMPESPAGSCSYFGNFPTANTTPGRYTALVYKNPGTLAYSNQVMGSGPIYWTGTAESDNELGVNTLLAGVNTTSIGGHAVSTAGAVTIPSIVAAQSDVTSSTSTLATDITNATSPLATTSQLNSSTSAIESAVTSATSPLATSSALSSVATSVSSILSLVTNMAQSVWTYATRVLSSFSFTPTVGGYATGQDPANLVLNATAASYDTTGTIGAEINRAGSAADPWSVDLPGSYSSGTAGFELGNMVTSITTALQGSTITVTTPVGEGGALNVSKGLANILGPDVSNAIHFTIPPGPFTLTEANAIALVDSNGPTLATTTATLNMDGSFALVFQLQNVTTAAMSAGTRSYSVRAQFYNSADPPVLSWVQVASGPLNVS